MALKYFDSPGADSHTIDVPIDDNLKEFSVSVAGHNPNISVVDPKKHNYDQGKELLNLENLKVSKSKKTAQLKFSRTNIDYLF